MIKKTFCILDGVGVKKESSLWKEGITDWHTFLHTSSIKGISAKRQAVHTHTLIHAKKALLDDNIDFFAKRIPQSEHWRLYKELKASCVFLDIEFSSVHEGYITCMSIYDGIKIHTLVRNNAWNESALRHLFHNVKLIVTFNGSSCDIPLVKKYFPGLISEKILHWDLRHSCARLGMSGGLKEIEKQLSISRNNVIVERLCNGDPFKLWRMYNGSGDPYYLDILVEYNREDTLNLETIADTIYPLLCKKIHDESSI